MCNVFLVLCALHDVCNVYLVLCAIHHALCGIRCNTLYMWWIPGMLGAIHDMCDVHMPGIRCNTLFNNK